MCSSIASSIFIVSILCVIQSTGWRAVPVNQAANSLRISDIGDQLSDIELKRDYLHSVYKFGWCTPDATRSVFLRKSINISLATVQETRASYIYLLDHKHSQNYVMQCVIMKAYVPRRYLFRKSRLPLYYCQGQVYYMMLNTIQKILIHEFYFTRPINLPISFTFEFYQSPVI